MKCNGCGNESAYHVRVVYSDCIGYEICDRCSKSIGQVGDVNIPDVFWPGHSYTSEHICDKMGTPIEMTSRKHKKYLMDKLGIREAGDPIRGARSMPPHTWREGVRRTQGRNF